MDAKEEGMLERISQVSILHHVAIVLGLLAIISSFGWFIHPVVYFLSFFYLFLVHERYILRLRRRLLFESNKQAAQRRLLSDSESVRWLNHAVAKVWPVCMENIASQKFLLPIIPWFLDKYKPWTARKVVVQNLYLGKKPPIFTDIRVIGRSADDDHLVMESGISFLSDDMSAVLAVKLRKRLGFGIWTKMHVTGMHIEGKALVGVKFLEEWPFLGRIRVSFVEPPYFQMTVKPIFSHGLDVTELPGIAGWLDKILSVAFEKSLVEPNMLVVDLGKFVSAPTEPWFEVDEKPPIANVKVEILEGADMKPSDMNGLADPYVKGKLGPYRFQTKIQWKTLNPEWREEFTIPIISWDVSSILALEVRDKDRIFDDMLGDYKLDIRKMQHGQRHDIWLALKNIKMGRLHLAVTVIEIDDIKTEQSKVDQAPQSMEDTATCSQADEENFSCETSLGFQSGASDEQEPIPIEGLEKMKVWVHRPGTNNVPQRWESRKGKVRRGDMGLNSEENIDSPVSQENETNSSDKNQKGKKRVWGPLGKMRRAAGSAKQLIGSAVHKKPKDEFMVDDELDVVLTPTADLHPVDGKRVGVNLVVDGVNAEELLRAKQKQDSIQSSEKGTVFDLDMKNTEKKDKPKAGIFKQAENAVSSLRKSFQKGRRCKEGADNSPEASCSGDSTPSPSPLPSPLAAEGVGMRTSPLPSPLAAEGVGMRTSPLPSPLAAEGVGMRTGHGNKPTLSRAGGIIREADTSTTYMSTGETPTPKMEHTTAESSAPDNIRDERASTVVEKLLMKESEQQSLLDSDLLPAENPKSINEELKSNQTKV